MTDCLGCEEVRIKDRWFTVVEVRLFLKSE